MTTRRRESKYGDITTPLEYYFFYRKYFKFIPKLAALTVIDRFCYNVNDHAERVTRVEEYLDKAHA
jgi:hypothetical protein